MNDDIKEAIQSVKDDNIERCNKIEERMSEGFKDIKESLHEFREDMNLKFSEFERKHDEQAKPLRDIVEKNDVCLRGNGKEGLVLIVSKIQDKINAYSKVIWVAIAAVIAAAVKMFFEKNGG